VVVCRVTFSLYSLICRYAKVSLLPNQRRVDEEISSFRLKLPTPDELERALYVKDCLEKKSLFKLKAFSCSWF
jgi:KUP system potassium uptake protein